MARCINCNAPLPDGSIVCAYCGNRNDVDLKGIHYYTTHENETLRTCPRCNIALKTIDLKLNTKFLIERCDQCLGLFFDPGELEVLLEATVTNVSGIDRIGLDSINLYRKPDQYPVAYIKCPVCSKLMNRINFGAKSGVIVDRCKAHGVWLDGGELRHLFEWMKLGGKILEQERREQKLREEEKKERELQELLTKDRVETSSFENFGAPLRQSDPDLFDMVHDAIRFFNR